MFEAAEVGQSLTKKEFKTLEPKLHQLVLSLQQHLRQTKQAVVIVVAGVEGAGKGEVVDRLHRWFDTRDVQTHAYWEETDEERQRPRFWRYWRTLPAHGTVSVMFGSWYTAPIVNAALAKTSNAEFEQEMRRITELEKTLADNGTIFIKLWFHLTKEEQQRRLENDFQVSELKKSPMLSEFSKSYDQFVEISGRALRLTDTAAAPWHIIEATDVRYRDIAVGNIVVSTLQNKLQPIPGTDDLTRSNHGDSTTTQDKQSIAPHTKKKSVLDKVDLSLSLRKDEYNSRLETLQQQLHSLAWEMNRKKRNALMLFEGWDAAGKGSAIRRVTAAIDARLYRVIPIAAPTDEEKSHHYLWRFWRHIPRAGYITIYDRSWYGRVLVERVENFATVPEWSRAYEEINNFEEHLTDHGIEVFKFWIHISPEEQLNRFREREKDSRKQHKITAEDWRNRSKWDDYSAAVNDMVAHTSTTKAPWTIIAGNNKNYARIQILETICARLEAALKSAK